MKKFNVGDKVRVTRCSYTKIEGNKKWTFSVGQELEIASIIRPSVVELYNSAKTFKTTFLDSEFEVVESFGLSQRKQIQQSLLKFYNNIHLYPSNEVLSEKIIDIVKDDTGIEYIFGDTILRELRRLRQEGKLDYECPNRKERIYNFKQITK